MLKGSMLFMVRKIVITIITSLLIPLLIFVAVKYASDILHLDTQDNEQTENSTLTKSTDHSDTSTEPPLPEGTSVPDTEPQETEAIPSQETTTPKQNENTVIPTTTPPVTDTQPSVKPEELPKWKQMYINHVTVWRTRYDHFALVYIDGDDIPELYMYGNNQSELCAFRDDAIYSLRMNGMGGGNYHKKSGRVMNVCVEGEYLAMYVYELTDVFRQIFYGREDKNVNPPAYYIENYTGAVSEEEFKNTVNQYINTNETEFLHQNAVTFDAFADYVTDF